MSSLPWPRCNSNFRVSLQNWSGPPGFFIGQRTTDVPMEAAAIGAFPRLAAGWIALAATSPLAASSRRFTDENSQCSIGGTFLAAPAYRRLASWRGRPLFEAPRELPGEGLQRWPLRPTHPDVSNRGPG